jgi:elongation factor 1-gamma
VDAKAQEDLHKALATLEKHLLPRTFIVGEAVTLADIVLVCALHYPFKLVLTADARAAYPSVTRWFLTCVNQPQFHSVLGDVPLCGDAAGAEEARLTDRTVLGRHRRAAPRAPGRPAPGAGSLAGWRRGAGRDASVSRGRSRRCTPRRPGRCAPCGRTRL